jgi:hypothetical protein
VHGFFIFKVLLIFSFGFVNKNMMIVKHQLFGDSRHVQHTKRVGWTKSNI